MRYPRRILVTSLSLLAIGAVWSVSETNVALKFTHKTHVEVNGMKCSECHAVAKEVQPGIHAIPGHNQCSDCHDVIARGECTKCHTNPRGASFGKPVSHVSPDWKTLHGMEASARASDCIVCHEQRSCDACHSGTNLTGKPHPPGYLFSHATDAAFGGRCLTCHETRNKCTDCHRAMLPPKHPFGSAWANNSGGAHVAEAKMFAESCLACHDLDQREPTCARCHNK